MLDHQNNSIAGTAVPLTSTPSVYMSTYRPECAHQSVPPPSSPNLFPAVELQRLIQDDILASATKRHALMPMLGHSYNLSGDRLLQAALLMDCSSPYRHLLNPSFLSGSGPPPFLPRNTSREQMQALIQEANRLDSLKTPQHRLTNQQLCHDLSASNVSPQMIERDTITVPERESSSYNDVSIPVKEGTNKRLAEGDHSTYESNRRAPNDVGDTSVPPKKRRKIAKEGTPRRPLTAYNLFFRDERAKIIADIEADSGPDDLKSSESETRPQLSTEEFLKQRVPGSKRQRRRPHRKIGFRVLATIIGGRWRELENVDRERLVKYREIAADDLKRYMKEMKEFREKEKKKLNNC